MAKTISVSQLPETLSLAECSDGFWLYDETRGMNLSMRAKTERAAFVEALEYYQKRLGEVEQAHKKLTEQVNTFVSQFTDEED